MAITSTSDRVVFNDFQRALSSDMNELQAALARNLTESVGRFDAQREVLSPTPGTTDTVEYAQVIIAGLGLAFTAGPAPGATITVQPGSAMVKLALPLPDMGGSYAIATQRELVELTVPPADQPAAAGTYLGRITVPVNSVDTLFQTRDIFDPLTGTFAPTPGTPVQSEVQFDWANAEFDFEPVTTAPGAGLTVTPPAVGDDKVIIGCCQWLNAGPYQGWLPVQIGSFTPHASSLNLKGLSAPKHTFSCGATGTLSYGGSAWTPYRGTFDITSGGGGAPGTVDQIIADSGIAIADEQRYEIWGFAGTTEELSPVVWGDRVSEQASLGGEEVSLGPVFAVAPLPAALTSVQGTNRDTLSPAAYGTYPPGSCVYLGAVYRTPGVAGAIADRWLPYSENNGVGAVQPSFLQPTTTTPLVGGVDAGTPSGEFDLTVGIPVPTPLFPVENPISGTLVGVNALQDTIGPTGTLAELRYDVRAQGASGSITDFTGPGGIATWIIAGSSSTSLIGLAPVPAADYTNGGRGVPLSATFPMAIYDVSAGAILNVGIYNIGGAFAGCFVAISANISGWVRNYRL